MNIKIGTHEVTLVPHAMDATLLVGEIDGFRINVGRDGWDLKWAASVSHGDDEGYSGWGNGDTVEDAVDSAWRHGVVTLARSAEYARRDFERLDVHAIEVRNRMIEAAEVARRAREIFG